MNVTKEEMKYRQLQIEDYLQRYLRNRKSMQKRMREFVAKDINELKNKKFILFCTQLMFFLMELGFLQTSCPKDIAK